MSTSAVLTGELTITPPIPVRDIAPDSRHLPAVQAAWNARYAIPLAELVFQVEQVDGVDVATRIVPSVAYGHNVGNPARELATIVTAHDVGRTFHGEIKQQNEYDETTTFTIRDGCVISENNW